MICKCSNVDRISRYTSKASLSEQKESGMEKDGHLVVICGVDGSGKSTQQCLTVDWFHSLNIPVVATKQPTDMYRKHPLVRKYLIEGEDQFGVAGIALLSAADRQHHIWTVVQPALEAGKYVICNRYVYSAYAYFVARGLNIDFVRAINSSVIQPDLTIFLDVPVDECRRRLVARDGAVLKHEEKQLNFLEEVRANFLKFRDDSFMVLDGTQNKMTIQNQIRKRCKDLFEL